MEGLPIFDIPWLVPGALALVGLLVALAVYGWQRKRKIAAEIKKMESLRLDPDEELRTLGIVGVRKLAEEPDARARQSRVDDVDDDLVHLTFHSKAPRTPIPAKTIVDHLVAEDSMAEPEDRPVPRFSPSRTVAHVESADSVSMGRHPGTYLDQASPLWQPSDSTANPDAVAFLLESLWAAMQAQSVALLRFDLELSSYAVDALVSERVTRQIDLFPAGGNMLNLVADDTSISILEPDAFGALRYHANPMISVGHAVAIAVHGSAERVLLVADVEPGRSDFDKQSLERFGDYADFLGRLLPDDGTSKKSEDVDALPGVPIAETKTLTSSIGAVSDRAATNKAGPTPRKAATWDPHETKPLNSREFEFDAEAAAEEGLPSIKVPSFPQASKSNGSNMLRSAIIADEMDAARATDEPLALALVVPHNAVELATQGESVVAAAEKELIARLRGVAGSSRVELFGELVVGVFCHAGPAFVEAWVERVEESGPDVQIGIALLRARHQTPEAFRADAKAALREAYERKEDCVIVD